MIPQWWLHLLKGEKITFYNLQLFVLKSEIICQEESESTCSRCPPFFRRRELLGLRPTDSWTLVTLSGVQIVIGGPEGDEPVTLRSPQVPWVSNFLTNLKIYKGFRSCRHIPYRTNPKGFPFPRLLFGNLLKLNFFLNLAWSIWKDFVS